MLEIEIRNHRYEFRDETKWTYKTFLNGKFLVTNRDPEHATARKLIKMGYSGKALFKVQGAEHGTVHELSDLAKYSIEENEGAGPKRRPYREFPRGR